MNTNQHSLTNTADYIRKRFAELGSPVKPSSRVAQMIECLFDGDGNPRFIPRDSSQFPIARQASRDLLQLEFILENIGTWISDSSAKSKFYDLRKDNVEPAVDQKRDSKGRDAQCELYFATVCHKSGLSPKFAEPDIVCNFKEDHLGLAVKRIKSLSSLENRIRDAANQVYRSKMTGIVAADVTLAANPEDQPLDLVVPERQLAQASRKRNDKFVLDHLEELAEWVRHKWVSGIIFTFHDLYAQSSSSYAMSTSTAAVALSDNQRRKREFLVFFDQFKTGLATKPENL